MKKYIKIMLVLICTLMLTGCGKSYMKEISYTEYQELLKNKETFILEDSRNGIIAADAAGIDVIGVPDLVDISDMTQSHLLCIQESLLKVLNLIK